MNIDAIAQVIGAKYALIAFMVMSGIAAIEAGIIMLLKSSALNHDKPKNPNDKRGDSANGVQK